MEVVTRQEAIDRGLSKYFTGKACRKGHTSPRYTLAGSCVQCVTESAARQREDDKRRLEQAQAAAS